MVAGPPSRRWHHSSEPQRCQIKRLDERIDHPDRVVFANVVVKSFRRQRGLPSAVALDESLHLALHHL